MEKNDAEVIEHGGEIWINQKYLEKNLILQILQTELQDLKIMRCEIQEFGKYQPCRVFIKNTLAIEITMSAVKTQAVIFRDKFRVNQHDKVLRKKQSSGLRLQKNHFK